MTNLQNHKSSNEVPNELFEQLNTLALEICQSYDCKLDYTHESVKDVEKVLSIISKEYKKTKDTTGLRGIALEFAAYIVKTIQKNTGKGIWYRDDSAFGKDAFPFEWPNKDNVIYPFSWCEKRIFDGKGDDVWFKYQALVLPKL